MSDRRILFFGDSHVAGVGDPTGHGWVGRLAAASFESGLALTVYNLGVRMETSQRVAARWKAETMPRLMPGADCRAAFSFGVNDTTVQDGRERVAPERSCAVLADILGGVAAIGLPVLMIGPAPVDDVEQNERIRILDESFAEVCRQADACYVPVYEPLRRSPVWMSEVAASDGAHPAADGYQALTDAIVSAGWVEWLARQRL